MELRTYTSELEICTESEAIQNACNPIAVAQTYRAIVRSLMDLKITPGMNQASKHPASRAVLGKLCDMSSMDHDSACYTELRALIVTLEN